MTDNTPARSASDEFEAAKAVTEALKTLQKPEQERVLRWVAESLGLANPALTPATVPAIPAIETDARGDRVVPTVDIASFVAAKQPRTDNQFVTTVAYYYRFEAPPAQRRNTINAQVAQDATRLANYDRLSDPINTLHNAKKQGYLDSAGRGEFAVNTVGENLVARTLPDDGSDTGKKRSPRKKKATAARKTAKKRG